MLLKFSKYGGALFLFAPVIGALAQAAPSACVAPLVYWPLDARVVGENTQGVASLGTYERISPDGRFILRSYSGALVGQVSLMELPAGNDGGVKVYRTPFSNEAFPVQGTWRYLVDVSGEHYKFKDVLTRQAAARPVFKGGMTGFYAAASELLPLESEKETTADAQQTVWIRSLSWPQPSDSGDQEGGPLQTAVLGVLETESEVKVIQKIGPKFICGQRSAADGSIYALPMLSVDGTEFSAVPQAPRSGSPSMRVYGLASQPDALSHPCDLRADLGLSPSKAVFGFSHDRAHAWLTFSDVGHVYVHDRQLKKTFKLDHLKHRVLASAFPGLTRDGRVVYGATWRDCPDPQRCPEQAGYVVADPYQSTAYRAYWKSLGSSPPKLCITHADVAAERARFAAFHGLPVGQ